MKKGFTLVEFVIYLTLVSLVLTSLVIWILSLGAVRDKNYVAVEVEANAQIVTSIIAREVRAATAIVNPPAGSAATVLELTRPSPEPGRKFELLDGVLWLTTAGQAAVQVSGGAVELTNLLFTNLAEPNDARDNLRASFTLRYREPASADFAYEIEVRTVISLRQ